MFLFCVVLFCFFPLIFPADTNSIFFHLVVENLILHIFLIIMIIMPCSGMFRNVPECSMFLVLSTPWYDIKRKATVDLREWRGEEQNREGGEMAQKELGGGRNRGKK